MDIPKQLQNINFRFILIKTGEKKALEFGWNKSNNYTYDDQTLTNHLTSGGNYGVLGGFGNLIVVDWDDEELRTKIMPKLPETFTIRTGKGGDGQGGYHQYFFSDDGKTDSFKILKNKETLADIQGTGKYVVAPNSKYPKGGIYQVTKNMPIATIKYGELKAHFEPWLNERQKPFHKQESVQTDEIVKEIKNRISVPQKLSQLGVSVNKNPTDCPFHSSKGGKCLSFNEDVWHCFHCEEGGDIFNLKMISNNIDFVQAKKEFMEELEIDKKEINGKRKLIQELADRKLMAKKLWSEYPYFYDEKKSFWFWDSDNFVYRQTDEITLLNLMQGDTISSRAKTEIINALKQVGRMKVPKEPNKWWVQFKNQVVDIETGQIFDASPEYFFSTSIPWSIGESEETPIMDTYVEQWVVKEGLQDETYIDTMFEWIAYCTLPNQFLQTILANTGAGSNGKGTFRDMLRKFIGEENYASSEMKLLTKNRFETSSIYRKAICVLPEVDAYDMQNTSRIKTLSGEDPLRYEFKGKTSFTEISSTKIMILTNSLPLPNDLSTGFFRRWLIVDFPHTFNVGQDILADIPDYEYNNLAKKCIALLQRLKKKKEFTNGGDFAERRRRYEERSNPVEKFVIGKCNYEPLLPIPCNEFYSKCNKWLKQHNLREMKNSQIKKALMSMDIRVGTKTVRDGGEPFSLSGVWLSWKEENQEHQEKQEQLIVEEEDIAEM